MQLLTGVDLIEIARVRHACERWGERFLTRVYTADELALYRGRWASLAARWAAKEAVAKLLGVGLRGLSSGGGAQVGLLEIAIVSEPSGRPLLQLSGAAASRSQQLALAPITISLSHTRDLAIAHAVAVQQPKGALS